MNRPELASVLRSARARVSPEDVGLPGGVRRRVQGLRREEVALLAGVSVDYVVRLEQGRGPHPSASVLGSLARALRLDRDERDQLFLLAGEAPPRPHRIESSLRPGVQRVLDRLPDLPVLVLDAKSDIIAWNPLAAALLGDFSVIAPSERNIVWMRFMGGPGRVSLTADEAEATSAQSVASLRACAARYPDDPSLLQLISRLRRGSKSFDQFWLEGRSAPWRSHTKTIDHPEVGRMVLDCDTLMVPDDDQSVVVYSARPGSREASALALLGATGIQQLSQSSH